jgi:hypothetical protein
LNATRNDLTTQNWQESFLVVDALAAGNEMVMAPLVVQSLRQRFKEPHIHVQLKALSLAKVLESNVGSFVRKELAGEPFAYALMRLAFFKTTAPEVREAVIDMIVTWLDEKFLFDSSGESISPAFLQGALDAILTGNLDNEVSLDTPVTDVTDHGKCVY